MKYLTILICLSYPLNIWAQNSPSHMVAKTQFEQQMVSLKTPVEAKPILDKLPTLIIHSSINPFYLKGDFDGNGKQDIAIWIKDTLTNKVGILFCMESQASPILVGAGEEVDGVDDFWWAGAWRTESSGTAPRDTLILKKIEGHSVKLNLKNGVANLNWD